MTKRLRVSRPATGRITVDVFRQAWRDLGAIAVKAAPDPLRLAERGFAAVTTNDYGEYDRLVEVISRPCRKQV